SSGPRTRCWPSSSGGSRPASRRCWCQVRPTCSVRLPSSLVDDLAAELAEHDELTLGRTTSGRAPFPTADGSQLGRGTRCRDWPVPAPPEGGWPLLQAAGDVSEGGVSATGSLSWGAERAYA